MKKIIAAQQSYAKVNGRHRGLHARGDRGDGARDQRGRLAQQQHRRFVRDYDKLPPVLVDRHQIMQILVNLISNAKHALEDSRAGESRAARRDRHSRRRRTHRGARQRRRHLARESRRRSSRHGFTTKKTGHGFGLHNCANAAQQMDGSLTAYSDGAGKGASFVLRMPVRVRRGRCRNASASRQARQR